MAVTINDGGLVWTARIDDSKIPEDIKQLQKMFAELNIDFINADTTALSLKKVQENVITAQKEIFNIQETSNVKLNADLVTSAAITQDKITDIVIQEAKIRTDASRDEAQALLNSNLPVQTAALPGTKPRHQTPQIDDILGSDASKQLKEAENLYKQVDQATKDYISELVELEIELGKVDAAQKKLNKANREGKISADDYRNGTEVLAARQKEIADSISLVTKRQKEADAASANEISSINGKKEALKHLIQQYNQLSVAERSTTQGKALATNIREVANELERVKRAGTVGFDDMGNAIKRQVGLLEKLKRQAEIYKNGITQATNPANIAKYNQKLEATNLQITKLSQAGKKGFDDLGNSTEKLSKKTNVLSKGFGFIRQAALFIPGIGIAGIFSLIGESVAALVTNLFKGNGALKTFAANFENIKGVMAAANKESGKQITDLKILYTAATNVNLSMKERLVAVNALQQEFPDYFGKIDDEVIANGKAQKSYDELVLSIQSASRARAAKDKIDLIAAEKLDIQFQKLKIENATAAEKTRVKEKGGGSLSLGGATVSQVVVTVEEQRLNIERRRLKALREQDLKDESLSQQEKFLIAFVGEKAITKAVIDEHKARAKAVSTKTDTELNSLLEKRKSLLQSIIDLERDALQSGLTKQATEIDKINERREKELQLLKETNAAIDKYNAKHKVNIAKVGQAEIDRINNAADTLIKNATYKKDAAEYLEAISVKENAFNEFQKIQEDDNKLLIDQAKDLYGQQLGDFENFVDLLQSEYDRLFDSLRFDGTDDIGQVTMFNGIKKKLDDARKKSAEDEIKAAQRLYEDLLKETKLFSEKQLAINEKYDKLEATLEKEKSRFSPEVYKARQKQIEDGRKAALDALNDEAAASQVAFKKLFKGVQDLSDKAARKVIEDAKALLKKLKEMGLISAEFSEQISKSLDEATESFNSRMPDRLNKVSAIFGELAGSVGQLNSGLGDTLQHLSDMASTASQVATAMASFAKGGPEGIIQGVTATVAALGDVVSGFAKAKKSAAEARQSLLDFENQRLAGEAEYERVIRERQRNEAKAGKLRIQGLQDEKKLLEEQRQTAINSYNEILKKLEQESFISGQKTKKKRGSFLQAISPILGGALGFLSSERTTVQNELASLAGKSFEEMEKLFTEGRLTDSAKQLFEQLRKIKDEGVDIDRLLEENKLAAQQLFTGTTAESIADSIIQGLEEGKRSVSDFADNFQDLMQQAFLNSLKFKYLEGPIQSFFEDFAAASESDGQLTSGEIDRLKSMYNSIITNAADQFEQLQQVAGINFNSPGTQGNTLTGSIKGMTEQQAELLAGQFGGLRITAIEQLKTAMQGIKVLQNIEINTARLHQMYDLWRRIELNGLKVV